MTCCYRTSDLLKLHITHDAFSVCIFNFILCFVSQKDRLKSHVSGYVRLDFLNMLIFMKVIYVNVIYCIINIIVFTTLWPINNFLKEGVSTTSQSICHSFPSSMTLRYATTTLWWYTKTVDDEHQKL